MGTELPHHHNADQPGGAGSCQVPQVLASQDGLLRGHSGQPTGRGGVD